MRSDFTSVPVSSMPASSDSRRCCTRSGRCGCAPGGCRPVCASAASAACLARTTAPQPRRRCHDSLSRRRDQVDAVSAVASGDDHRFALMARHGAGHRLRHQAHRARRTGSERRRHRSAPRTPGHGCSARTMRSTSTALRVAQSTRPSSRVRRGAYGDPLLGLRRRLSEPCSSALEHRNELRCPKIGERGGERRRGRVVPRWRMRAIE